MLCSISLFRFSFSLNFRTLNNLTQDCVKNDIKKILFHNSFSSFVFFKWHLALEKDKKRVTRKTNILSKYMRRNCIIGSLVMCEASNEILGTQLQKRRKKKFSVSSLQRRSLSLIKDDMRCLSLLKGGLFYFDALGCPFYPNYYYLVI